MVDLRKWIPFLGSGKSDHRRAPDSNPDRSRSGTDRSRTTKSSTQEYSDRKISKRIFTLERQIDRIDNAVEDHKENYINYLEKGVDAGPGQRSVYAIRARLERFKSQIHQLERYRKLQKLMKWETYRGQQDIRNMVGSLEEEQSIDIQSLLEDPDELQDDIDTIQAEIQYGMSELTEIMDTTQVDIADLDISLDEEMELMDMMASREVSPNDIDLNTDPIQAHVESDVSVSAAEKTGSEASADVESDFDPEDWERETWSSDDQSGDDNGGGRIDE